MGGVVAIGLMPHWRRRKGENAQLASTLRGHVETTWAIACALTGDEATAREVVKEVVRGTLPQPHRFRQRGPRLEVVIAATEAAAARVFSPLDHRVRVGGFAAALGPQASALRRAFSRRISWDMQALLWASEVEGIAESDVADRLGQVHSDGEAGRIALCLAYLDLRRDLDADCRTALGNVFGSSTGPEKRAGVAHVGSCARCQAEAEWLTDLRSALRSLPPAMPPDVWEEAQRLALDDFPGGPHEPPRSDAATQPGGSMSAPPWPSRMDSRTRAVVVPSAADRAKAVGDAATAANGRGRVLFSRAAAAQKVEAEEVEAQKEVDRVVCR